MRFFLVNVTSPARPGSFAKISPEDAELALLYKWSLTFGPEGKFYVRGVDRSVKPPKSVKLHRLILNAPNDMDVDHINGDTLDNRRENLRLCTMSQNLANAKKPRNNKSAYKGVSWHKGAGKWRATINHLGKQIHLGFFDDPAEAGKAYDSKAVELYGQFALTNRILAGDVRKEMQA